MQCLGGIKRKKAFFFEKKKQKLLSAFQLPPMQGGLQRRLIGSFFRKRTAA
jgi:hypothetical protein